MGRTDIITGIGTTLRKADKIDEYNQIMDLQSTMFEMQGEILKLTEENQKLKQRLEIKNKVILKNHFYYLDDKGPFCTRCLDVKNNLVLSHPTYLDSDYAECPECKTVLNYTGKERNDPGFTQDYSNLI